MSDTSAMKYYNPATGLLEVVTGSGGAITTVGGTGTGVGPVVVDALLNGVSVTGPGASVLGSTPDKTFQAVLSNTTTPAATVLVQVSNDNTNWMTLGTITLSTAGQVDGFSAKARWAYVRGNVQSISGASATVTLMMGV